ncbi:MAG: FtsQ-type POTRA domain-containing protein [Elusimicrobiota bacterium]
MAKPGRRKQKVSFRKRLSGINIRGFFRAIWFIIKWFIIISVTTYVVLFVRKTVLNSDFLNIKEIVVKNNKYIDSETVLDISKIKKGENIFKPKTKSIRKNLKDKFPPIKDVKLFRYYPDKIVLEIIDRAPLARIERGDEKLVIDSEGVMFSSQDECLDKILIRLDENCAENMAGSVVNILMYLQRHYNNIYNRIIYFGVNEKADIEIKLQHQHRILLGKVNNKNLNRKIKHSLIVLEDAQKKKKFTGQAVEVDARFFDDISCPIVVRLVNK